jgi:glycosyltransferase involved in cell wall biosynthesis
MHKHQLSYHCHLWCPELYSSRGGIQCYSSFCLKAFQDIYPNSYFNIFLKQDTEVPLTTSNLHFRTTGHLPLLVRTPAFASQLIGFGLLHCPQLIFSTHLNFSVAAYFLKQLIGIPYWVVAHGIEAWSIRNLTLQAALKYADQILAVSHYTRNRLLKEQNLNPNNVSVLPNTFDQHRFQPAAKPAYLLERYQLQPNQPIILTVARLAKGEKYKGYDQILQVIPQIRQIIPNIHYMIVGKGDDLPRIEQLTAQLGLQDCVTLAGFVPDEQLCDYYNLSDVFAMPSKGEGFGIVYLEALACGKPVLAGNQDGAIDALCYGELGALVNPDNLGEITETLIKILRYAYPNSLIYQPEALRQKVIDNFGFERFQQTLASLLDKHFQATIR